MNWEILKNKLINSKYHYFHTDNGVLLCGDCLEVMKLLPNESIDLILTDLPYLISYKTNYRKDKNHKFCSPITNDNNPDVIRKFLCISYNLLRNNSAIYCFTSWKTIGFFKILFEQYFKIKNVIIWVKNNWTAGDLEAQYGQQYECILYANKGRAYIKGKRLSDVWYFNRVSGTSQEHQNQKPVILIEQILRKHTNKQDLVLDPFLGSGTTAVACERLNRRWIGIEISEEYCKIAKKRLTSMQQVLFYKE